MLSWFTGKKSENLYDYLDWDKITSNITESNIKRKEAFYNIYELYNDMLDAIKKDTNDELNKTIQKSFDIINKHDSPMYKLLSFKKEETDLNKVCAKFNKDNLEHLLFFINFLAQLTAIFNGIRKLISLLKNPIDKDEYKKKNEKNLEKMDSLDKNVKALIKKIALEPKCIILIGTFSADEYDQIGERVFKITNKQKAYEQLITTISKKVKTSEFNNPIKNELNLSKSVRDLTQLNSSKKQEVQGAHEIHNFLKRNYEQYDFYCRSYNDVCDTIKNDTALITKISRKLEKDSRITQKEFRDFINSDIISSDSGLRKEKKTFIIKFTNNYIDDLVKHSKTIYYWYENIQDEYIKNNIFKDLTDKSTMK